MKKITSFIFFLLFAFHNVAIAQNSEEHYIYLYETNGYLQAQKFSLNKISNKFPDLRGRIEKAQMKFKQSFGKAQNAIINEVKRKQGEDFADLNLKTNRILEDNLKNKTISRKIAINYINKVHNRARGNIKLPFLKTLLFYQYNDAPSKEFTRGYVTSYDTKNNPKSQGINIRLQIPKSWSKIKASKDNFVLIFESKNGGGNSLIIYSLKIYL